MRDSYKVLAEKYSAIQESFGEYAIPIPSDLKDLVIKYPDAHDFLKWLLKALPTERLPAALGDRPYALGNYTRDYSGVYDWIDDAARLHFRSMDIKYRDLGFAGKRKSLQAVVDAEYNVYQVYKSNLNKDNPGVPDDY